MMRLPLAYLFLGAFAMCAIQASSAPTPEKTLPPEIVRFVRDKELHATLQDDRHFWLGEQKKMIGSWLTASTSVKEVCDFATKVFGQENFDGFTGDRRYVQTPYSNKLYSKLRSSQAGVYAWRAGQTSKPEEQQRMSAEADFAFRPGVRALSAQSGGRFSVRQPPSHERSVGGRPANRRIRPGHRPPQCPSPRLGVRT